MTKMILLLVEDDEAQIDRVDTSIQEWNNENQENARQIRLISAKNEIEANEKLAESRIDCAIVDIRIPEDGGKENAKFGNELIREIFSTRGIPVAIFSGNLAEVDKEIAGLEHVKQFPKGDAGSVGRAIEWLARNWDMMELLRGSREEIEKASAAIFNKRLWPHWSEFPGDLEPQEKVKIIARQYGSHLVELLGIENPENSKWHPYEAYIHPSANEDRAHTGDIFELAKDEFWIVLSPQCDMATQKISNVLLARCKVGEEEWEAAIKKIQEANGDGAKISKEQKRLRKFVNQNIETRRHFLPPLHSNDKPMMVDFGDTQTIPLSELNKKLDLRRATVSAPFLSNLIQRFGSHISRTGQPNIDVGFF
ncbi:hypothetical protein [Pelagibacterium sp.]|uniref:hypothetical protein n=1 Tax=Pelagibacterium sp. TaxID=1967288 RepID=UPI003BADA19B